VHLVITIYFEIDVHKSLGTLSDMPTALEAAKLGVLFANARRTYFQRKGLQVANVLSQEGAANLATEALAAAIERGEDWAGDEPGTIERHHVVYLEGGPKNPWGGQPRIRALAEALNISWGDVLEAGGML